MKNTVSSPTAQRLKAAGFPQPDIEAGQVWREERYAHIVIGEMEDGFSVCFESRTGPWIEVVETLILKNLEGLVFAPTATDILAQLGDNYNLTICSQFFRVEQMKADEYFVINYWQSDNPAEAAALAWLEIHEKKAFTPNARIKFVREQVVECYDAEGNQTVLHIDSSMGKEYEAIVTDETVTIESVFGLITLPRKEAFILEWL